MNKICVWGLGYIGFPTALLLASKGFNVVGIDPNVSIVGSANSSKSHILEDGLNSLLEDAQSAKRFKAQTSPEEGNIHVICVPTPFKVNGNEKECDLSYVISAFKEIVKLYRTGDLVVLESTIPIGTMDDLITLFYDNRDDIDYLNIVYCPERILPGNLIYELQNNDRVIGGNSENALQLANNFYSSFVSGEIYLTNFRTAELCKLTENSYRDVNIAFANELSLICENSDINVYELISLVNKHPRVNVLQPGIGVGGHCIAIDPWFIVQHDKINTKLIKLSRERNLDKTAHCLNNIFEYMKDFEIENHRKPKVGFLGLSYKPDIDDLRESPAAYIVSETMKIYDQVIVCEPNLEAHDNFILHDIDFVLAEADLVFGLVAHKEFINNANKLKLEGIRFIDFCGIAKC